MKPQSISRLASLFLLVVACCVVLAGTYLWHQTEQVSHELGLREEQSAEAEVRAGLNAISKHANALAKTLTLWDETRQQLSDPEFYPLWRDNRVHEAGMLPAGVEAVALYDRRGQILSESNPAQPMPQRLYGPASQDLLLQEQGRSHILVFRPVFADPDGKILLGHLGIKFDYVLELQQTRAYQFADLNKLRVYLEEGRSIDLSRATDVSHYAIRPNPDRVAFQKLFLSSLLHLVVIILTLLLFAAWTLLHLLVQPLRAFSAEIDALRDAGGSLKMPANQTSGLPILELDNMRRSFNDYQKRLTELHNNLEQNSRDFHDQARRDALTGTFNRRAFDEDWKSLGEDRRLGQVALLLFDCDHFKAINDTYGHQVGDQVIQHIAEALLEALRSADRLYRLGGDEFATLLSHADALRAEAVAERCLDHVLSVNFRQYGLSEPATISVGIALSEGEGITLHELQKRADLAMYTAKRPGSRKLVFYRTDMGGMATLVGNREISAVFQAIENPDLIELHYQSVIRLPMAEKEYVEALARIRFEGELIGPGAIFPIIQARNLDMEFDLAVLRALERDLTQGRLPPGQGVSVNLSAPSIVNGKVVDALIELIRSQPGRKMVAEITETALITQIDIASDNIRRLRETGCLVALDDFGSGYSSLSYLASMPVDLVKFDISMVRKLESSDNRQRLMMEEIANLVVTAGYQVVAEGVETRELLDRVIRLGFSHAQGYYFDRPTAPTA